MVLAMLLQLEDVSDREEDPKQKKAAVRLVRRTADSFASLIRKEGPKAKGAVSFWNNLHERLRGAVTPPPSAVEKTTPPTTGPRATGLSFWSRFDLERNHALHDRLVRNVEIFFQSTKERARNKNQRKDERIGKSTTEGIFTEQTPA